MINIDIIERIKNEYPKLEYKKTADLLNIQNINDLRKKRNTGYIKRNNKGKL